MPTLRLAAAIVLALGLLPTAVRADRPNVVFIIADDLGYGDLGCFGQTKIRTPRIDSLARDGMRLTQMYSGSNVCAPSRCVLMTGLHTGHAFIRENRQAKGFDEGQVPVPSGALRLPLTLHELGYTLGGYGKWGLGPVGSTGDPLSQGFSHFFGYNCQAVAHNYYPVRLWDDDRPFRLDNPPFAAHQKLPEGADLNAPESYKVYVGRQYAPDVIAERARQFVRENRDRPFVLYFATTVPHLALQVPDDSMAEYAGTFPETPYPGGRGYLPQRQPRAAYAAMISRMDREVGRLLDLLAELKLDQRTIVVFVSDNGPLYDELGGTDSEFFNSHAGLRGRKGSYYEGGFRVPGIVRWPGHIAPGTTSDRLVGFEDWLPTLLDLAGASDRIPASIDGLSLAPTLRGQTQEPRPFLYRESPGYGGQQCVRIGSWKAIRTNLNPGPKAADQAPGAVELYDLATDPAETTDVAAAHPEVVARMQAVMAEQHRASPEFPIKALDRPSP
jgi:arylsulfatase